MDDLGARAVDYVFAQRHFRQFSKYFAGTEWSTVTGRHAAIMAVGRRGIGAYEFPLPLADGTHTHTQAG